MTREKGRSEFRQSEGIETLYRFLFRTCENKSTGALSIVTSFFTLYLVFKSRLGFVNFNKAYKHVEMVEIDF